MLREHLRAREEGWEPLLRRRGGDVSRIENLSDAVFAFALTLLVVSTSAPATYAGLRAAFLQLPAFAACFAMQVWCWHCHDKFFRRCGLEHVATVVWNALLLSLILFYVFPMKFTASMLLGMVTAGPESARLMFTDVGEVAELMRVYSGGFAGVFLLFALLHRHALGQRERLGLSPVEELLTRGELRAHLISVAIGLVSFGLTFTGLPIFWAGAVYFAMGPAHWWHGAGLERRARALAAATPTP